MKKENNGKSGFNQIFIISGKLFLITAISATLLSLVYSITEPAKDANMAGEEKRILKELIPAGDPGKKEMINTGPVEAQWLVRDKGKTAYAVLQLMASGYGGPMRILACYKTDGEVVRVQLLSNTETPGLGKKAETQEYMKKFLGKGGKRSGYPIPVTKAMLALQQRGSTTDLTKSSLSFADWLFGRPKGDVDTVTGATITFTGISKSLETGSQYVKNALGGSQ